MPDLFTLANRVVAVIGAGSGIGEAVALGAANQGARFVACLDINEEAAARVAKAIAAGGVTSSGIALDIADEHAVASTFDQIAAERGRLDGVVCTPAINVRKPILNYTGDEFDEVVRVNLRGNFNVLRTAGRIMTEQGSGSLVLFSSIRSLVTEPGQSVYAMTKAGILQLVKTAATEWATRGVRVNAVGPGVIETPLTAQIKNNKEWYDAYAKKSPMQRWGQAGEMVGPTLFLLSDAASYVTGTIIYADGGWLAADGRFTPPGMS
jgi:NAD(P)-dependent dehydrogenase (short-subunit alcohol dehydrogenase family)